MPVRFCLLLLRGRDSSLGGFAPGSASGLDEERGTLGRRATSTFRRKGQGFKRVFFGHRRDMVGSLVVVCAFAEQLTSTVVS